MTEITAKFIMGYYWGNLEFVTRDALENAAKKWCDEHPGSTYRMVKEGAEITTSPENLTGDAK